MTTEIEKRLITFREACARYGISRQTIYRAVMRGDLTIIKIGRASRLDLRQADDFFGVFDSPRATQSLP